VLERRLNKPLESDLAPLCCPRSYALAARRDFVDRSGDFFVGGPFHLQPCDGLQPSATQSS
jgi:hypothetical protein